MGAVLLGVVEGHPLLQVGRARGKLSKPEQSSAQDAVGLQEERGVLGTLGQGEELFRQLLRCL